MLTKCLGSNGIKPKTVKIGYEYFDNFVNAKGGVLKLVAQIYDPLRMLLLVAIVGRMFLQKLWGLDLDWNTEFLELKSEWINIVGE